MACHFEYNGKTYDQDGLAKALEEMHPSEAHKYIEGVQHIPNAPFKKSWDELALKRVLTEAVKSGYDAVSWTPGEAQAARYDLSKQVDSVRAIKRSSDGNYTLAYIPKGERNIGENSFRSMAQGTVPENKLADYVGKDLAEKIVKDGGGKYEGLDLKVGGEGMKAFYDKMLVDRANSLVKKMGGKVEYENIPTSRSYTEKYQVYDKDGHHVKDFDTKNDANQYLNNRENGVGGGEVRYAQNIDAKKERVPIIKITPAMREKIQSEGFPLFTAPQYIPVDHDPFKDKPKLVPVEGNPFQ